MRFGWSVIDGGFMPKAHNIDQEYWLLYQTKCECGKSFEKKDIQIQAVRPGEDASYDDFEMQCSACGRKTTVTIDISSYFGKSDLKLFEKVYENKNELRKLYLSSAVPMNFVMKYLDDLAKARDESALAFIAGVCLYHTRKIDRS
jgi:hypothetical protein